MDWSGTRQGYLLTGDCTRHIHLWTPRESDWLVSQQTFSAHSSSVEDIQVDFPLICEGFVMHFLSMFSGYVPCGVGYWNFVMWMAHIYNTISPATEVSRPSL